MWIDTCIGNDRKKSLRVRVSYSSIGQKLMDGYMDRVCLSVAYIGPNSRTERPRKTKIGNCHRGSPCHT